MGARDPRVDAYIAKSADFARPILEHLREAVHAGCPDVEEDMKWSMPAFMYKGMLASMAAFKNHCAFGFWKGALLEKLPSRDSAMGQFGRITAISDLPRESSLVRWIREAAALNDRGVKVPRNARSKGDRRLTVPAYLTAALRRNRRALATWEGFGVGQRREYVEWVTEAKTAETRKRRLEAAVGWIAGGRSRHWKYVRK